MMAPDLERVLREVSTLAWRAGDLALGSPDFPAHEARAVLKALTGARLSEERSRELGPERAGAVHFAKAIVVLSSMAGVPHGLSIGMAGVLDDLRAPARARGACTADERPLHGPMRSPASGRSGPPQQVPQSAHAAAKPLKLKETGLRNLRFTLFRPGNPLRHCR